MYKRQYRAVRSGHSYPVVTTSGIQELYYYNKKFYNQKGQDITPLVIFDIYYSPSGRFI